MELVLIRGLPGSGKSTAANSLIEHGYVHFEAVMQLMKNGLYKFNYDNLDSAHETFENKIEQALLENKKVVVSNVFSTVYNTFPSLTFILRNDVD